MPHSYRLVTSASPNGSSSDYANAQPLSDDSYPWAGKISGPWRLTICILLVTNISDDYHMIISTPHGNFRKIRKDTVAITVVKVKRSVRHHRILVALHETTHLEHRRIPTICPTCGEMKPPLPSWADYIALYDLKGEAIQYNEPQTRKNLDKLEN